LSEYFCYVVARRPLSLFATLWYGTTATVTARLLPSITGGKLPDGQSSIIEVDDMARSTSTASVS